MFAMVAGLISSVGIDKAVVAVCDFETDFFFRSHYGKDLKSSSLKNKSPRTSSRLFTKLCDRERDPSNEPAKTNKKKKMCMDPALMPFPVADCLAISTVLGSCSYHRQLLHCAFGASLMLCYHGSIRTLYTAS